MFPDFKELTRQLRQREFRRDFTKIELVRGDGKRSYSGPGYIKQRDPDGFEIQVYAEGKLDFSHLGEMFISRPGVLYTDNEYYKLQARDQEGIAWSSARILVSTGGAVGENGFFVSAKASEVEFRIDGPMGDSGIEMVSFENFDFPATTTLRRTTEVGAIKVDLSGVLDAASFVVGENLEFHLWKDDGVKLLVSSKEPKIPVNFDRRVVEAFVFALGAAPTWHLIKRTDKDMTIIRLRSTASRYSRVRALPPIANLRDLEGFTWKLFGAFLTKILEDVDSWVHPLTSRVYDIVWFLDTSIQGQALACCVAVESLVNGFFTALGLPDQKALSEIESLSHLIESWNGDPDIVRRAKGSIGAMKSARADDRLRCLTKKCAIPEEGREAWKKLRNIATHGRWAEIDTQELIDFKYKAIVLFNQIVFNIVGYEGVYTDYGSRGWPFKEYPLATDETPIIDKG